MKARLKKKRQLLALQDPTASDLEEETAEPTHTTLSFVQTIMKIFVNTKLATQKPLPPIPISSFSLTDVETALSTEVDELVEDEDYKVYQRIVSIKPSVTLDTFMVSHKVVPDSDLNG